ncbi:unnamed protein product [Paramecium octaurelia]|uniref:Uncharacterized protein n=1 Tax=Paramecium octaurelia TaxID=43137 RepID=A0A8S1YPJ1_PAROT|nr:unnamed protein product [Paramecium octaurelia]
MVIPAQFFDSQIQGGWYIHRWGFSKPLWPEYESLSVYGMLRQNNKKPKQMVIQIGYFQFVPLLMVLHQHLVVQNTLFVYGMLRQEKNMSCQIIDIKTFQHNFKLQFLITTRSKKVFHRLSLFF